MPADQNQFRTSNFEFRISIFARIRRILRGGFHIARYGHSWRGIKPKVAAEHGAFLGDRDRRLMPKLPRLTARQIASMLEKAGLALVSLSLGTADTEC